MLIDALQLCDGEMLPGLIPVVEQGVAGDPGRVVERGKSRDVFDPNHEAGSGDCHPESSVVRAGLPLRI